MSREIDERDCRNGWADTEDRENEMKESIEELALRVAAEKFGCSTDTFTDSEQRDIVAYARRLHEEWSKQGEQPMAYRWRARNSNTYEWGQWFLSFAPTINDGPNYQSEPLYTAPQSDEAKDAALDLLAVMFDAYEEGPDCYEDPDDCAGHLGKAIKLDEATFDRIADLLNKYRPVTAIAAEKGKP